MTLSIMIPCYKYSPFLCHIIEKLENDTYEDKEILVVIDEPTKKSNSLSKKFKNVHFFFNDKRLGKSNALNNLSKQAKGRFFLFLDSDIRIKGNNFLAKVVDNIEKYDIIDFKVDAIRKSFFSKIVNYDYLVMNLYEHLFSGVKRSMGVNGAAFAIKRDFFESIGGFKNVPLEDWEIGFQSYMNDRTYRHVEDVLISTNIPSFMNKWALQRKRWGIGAGIQCRNHWKDMLKAIVKYPKISLLGLLFFFPMVITFLITFSLFEDALFFSLMLLTFKVPILFPILFFASWSLLLFKNIFLFGLSYISTSLLFYVASRKIKFNYMNREFFCYYILYSPLWFILFSYNFARGFAYKRIGLDINHVWC